VEPARRSRARGVEEVAVARDRVGPEKARARGALELGLLLLVEKQRALGATGQLAFLESEDEDGLESARAGAQEVDHRNASRLAGCGRSNRGVVQERHDLLARDLLSELVPALELVEEPRDLLVGSEGEPGRPAR